MPKNTKVLKFKNGTFAVRSGYIFHKYLNKEMTGWYPMDGCNDIPYKCIVPNLKSAANMYKLIKEFTLDEICYGKVVTKDFPMIVAEFKLGGRKTV